jgi:hypothetical protein
MKYTDYYNHLNEAFINKDEFNDALNKSKIKIMKYTDYYNHLNEAFVNKDEFNDALSKSTIQYITVEMDKSGKVYFSPDFENKVTYENRKAYFILNFKDNVVELRHGNVGNRIDSGNQQLLQQLKKDNIINSEWTVSFKDDEGLYKNGKYTHIQSTFDKLPVSYWNRTKRLNFGENLILYHGTSTEDLPTIMKYGLQPLGRKYTTPGSATRIRTEENKDFLYLATDFRTAYRYAKDRASSQMRRLHKKKWEYLQYRETQYWDIQPVVLEVTIPDFTKLKSDDDRVIRLMKDKAEELWNQLSDEEKSKEWEQTKLWFKKIAGFTPKETDKSSFYWIMSDNGLQYVLDRFDKSAWNDWKASIKSYQQVAYKGFIPPQYLKVKEL